MLYVLKIKTRTAANVTQDGEPFGFFTVLFGGIWRYRLKNFKFQVSGFKFQVVGINKASNLSPITYNL